MKAAEIFSEREEERRRPVTGFVVAASPAVMTVQGNSDALATVQRLDSEQSAGPMSPADFLALLTQRAAK